MSRSHKQVRERQENDQIYGEGVCQRGQGPIRIPRADQVPECISQATQLGGIKS